MPGVRAVRRVLVVQCTAEQHTRAKQFTENRRRKAVAFVNTSKYHRVSYVKGREAHVQSRHTNIETINQLGVMFARGVDPRPEKTPKPDERQKFRATSKTKFKRSRRNAGNCFWV